MAVSLIAQAAAGGVGFVTPAQTGAINTTGATLFLACLSYLSGPGTMHDSQSNTWTKLTTVVSGARQMSLWYVIAPTTNASHTFDQSAAPGFDGLAVAAFDPGTPVFDAESAGGSSAGTTVQPGTDTPGGATNLLITGLGGDANTSHAIGSPFAIASSIVGNPGNSFGAAVGWLEQAAATAQNPTWTVGANGSVILAAMACFTFGAAGGLLWLPSGSGFVRGRSSMMPSGSSR